MNFIDDMLNPQISKEAAQVPQGEDKATHEVNKLQANAWIADLATNTDIDAVEKEYQEKLAEEARMLGKTAAVSDDSRGRNWKVTYYDEEDKVISSHVIKDRTEYEAEKEATGDMPSGCDDWSMMPIKEKTAAYEQGDTVEETLKKDYKRDVEILSDYALAEIVAGIRGHQEQNSAEMFHEHKEDAKKEISSNRKKVEEEVLKATGMSAQVDWKKAFERFSKEAKPEEPKEKDLFPKVEEKDVKFDKPSEDKFKLPTKEEMVPAGNGREADERQEVTKQAVPVIKEASLVKKAEVTPSGLKNKLVEMGYSEDSANAISGQWQAGKTIGTEPKTKLDVDKAISELSKEAHCGSCSGDLDHKQAEILPSAVKNKLVEMGYSEDSANAIVGQWQATGKVEEVGTEPKTRKDIERAIAELSKTADESVQPIKREQLYDQASCEGCPVCGGEGKDLRNNEVDHLACSACGISYAPKEIQSCASKADVIKKIAEIQSPWTVEKLADGTEAIVRREIVSAEEKDLKKESEEDTKEDLQK